MSTDYRPLTKIRFTDLFDGRLEKFQVREKKAAESSEMHRCLTDGCSFVWTFADDHGFVDVFSRYASNAPGFILGAIESAFDTEIVSEHDPLYWGFNTQEEWYAAWDKIALEDREQFYQDIMKYVRGEKSSLKPGTVGMQKAEIAKRLVSDNPHLKICDNREELFEAIEDVYSHDHAVVVTLSEKDMAMAQLITAHKDKLPWA
jgi:hypothetical protein